MFALIDSLQEILYTLKKNKLRTFLTAFGVFWGIFMLIMLLGAGKGLQNGITSNFGSDASNSVWVNSRKTSVPYAGLGVGREIFLTNADVDAVQDLSSVLLASSSQQLNATVTYLRNSQSYRVNGVSDGYFEIKIAQEQRAGRNLHQLDSRDFRKVATIGSVVAKTLFGEQDPMGQTIAINAISFTVVGVFYDRGENGRASERIYIPLSLYQKTFGQGNDKVQQIAYIPHPSADPFKTEDEVMALLRQRHSVAPTDRSALQANNRVKQSQWVNALFGAINAFIWFVGLGTLTAGIVGISNIMMITVKERTLEIGVRKALGATPFNIVSTLLFESILVTAIAGYVGLVLGVGLLEAINLLLQKLNLKLDYFQRPEVDFSLALAAIVILVLAGALAGLAPAWRAAKIAPIEAMRG